MLRCFTAFLRGCPYLGLVVVSPIQNRREKRNGSSLWRIEESHGARDRRADACRRLSLSLSSSTLAFAGICVFSAAPRSISRGRLRSVGCVSSNALALSIHAWTVRSIFLGSASKMLLPDKAHFTRCSSGKTVEYVFKMSG